MTSSEERFSRSEKAFSILTEWEAEGSSVKVLAGSFRDLLLPASEPFARICVLSRLPFKVRFVSETGASILHEFDLTDADFRFGGARDSPFGEVSVSRWESFVDVKLPDGLRLVFAKLRGRSK